LPFVDAATSVSPSASPASSRSTFCDSLLTCSTAVASLSNPPSVRPARSPSHPRQLSMWP
jgi:hypothetical protein